ncbi:endophilin-A3 [Perca flavescens]|uniref:endophilin-A3 n=1 Tax=Perca flavescens TaxID=8167 RepID=UPI00106ED828|nr:endophilin-A3-like [Perca flavescens]
MSVSGMKKQLHKASQLLNERLMGAEGTKMDDDFLKMEKSVEVLQALLVELLSRTTEFLQPHPGARAKLSVLNTMSRIRGHGGGAGYPQTESMLGDCMSHYGRELGPASEFGGALTEAGGALQEVAQARDALGVDIKRTFIDPLEQLQNTELKEIRFQLKKLNGRRLDFDYKRRRRGKVPAEEVQWAWDKFLLSKELAERSMFVLLQSDVDQLSRLAALVAAQLDFHRNAHRILLGLHGNLQASWKEEVLLGPWEVGASSLTVRFAATPGTDLKSRPLILQLSGNLCDHGRGSCPSVADAGRRVRSTKRSAPRGMQVELVLDEICRLYC